MSDEEAQAAGEIPSMIGRYQVTGALGFGAMGAVYKAFDPVIKRPLAIKTIRVDIPPQSPQYRAFKERFYQEARISGTLSHPNIVTLFDVGEENNVPFLAMEYVDGKTIAAILEEGNRFKPERVIGLVSQVAAALDYAHSQGVVHRDIKPSNLIVSATDRVKVSDFGIAKLVDSEITYSGALLGTPSYMSPEQAMGDKLDGRSDIFSLGVVAFEMLAGQQPFPGANVTSILYKLVHVDPVEPADLEMNGLVPQKWREVFHKVLAKKPESRYQTGAAFVQDLEFCLGSWFAGLGSAETVTIQVPAQESTVTIPNLPLAAAPAAAPDAAAPTKAEEEPSPTVVLGARAPAASDATTADVATVLLPAAPAVEDVVPATVLMASTTGSQTLPLEPTVQDLAPGAEAASSPSPRAAVPPGWIFGGVAAAVVLALGVAGWALRERSQAVAPGGESASPAAAASPLAAAPGSAPALPTSGALRIESEPSGAGVRVNGQARGQTPLDLSDLPFGRYEVRVERKGFDAQTRTVSLDARSAIGELRFTLSPPSVPAEADIVSTPPGASVSVDGRPVGSTPLIGLQMKAGKRKIEVALDGYETWTGTVDVAAGETGHVDLRLRALPQPSVPPTPEPLDTTRLYDNTAKDVDSLAKRLSGTSPSYPSDRAGRLRSGERVSVLVRFVVTETGEVQDVSVVESGGKTVDDVVVAAVRGWKFQPATKRGTRVKVQVLFKQTFLGG
jgi:TonB family protein